VAVAPPILIQENDQPGVFGRDALKSHFELLATLAFRTFEIVRRETG
jgi:hypothetical protein